MSTSQSVNILRSAAICGVSGAGAVPVQTIALNWLQKIIQEKRITGSNFAPLLKKLYDKQGVKIFYKGTYHNMIAGSIARFGDLSANFAILDFFQSSEKLSKTPIFLQSGITWGLASTWRLLSLPFLIKIETKEGWRLSHQQFKSENLRNKLRSGFQSKIRPQIAPLYFWFTTQNYLDYYLPNVNFKDNINWALIKYSFMGFSSMITLDLCTILYQKTVKKVSYPRCKAQLFIKGCHGVIFCTTSNYLRQKVF